MLGLNEMRPVVVKTTLMTAEEKETIKGVISLLLKEGKFVDSNILARQFKRLPATIRKLIVEVKAEPSYTRTCSNLSWQQVSQIEVFIRHGVYASDICAYFNCTPDDVEDAKDEFVTMTWQEIKEVRRKYAMAYGRANWPKNSLADAIAAIKVPVL